MTYTYLMTYSLDLRQRVVAYVEQGGSEAASHFKVSPWCVGDWCKRDDKWHIKRRRCAIICI
jgi:transposase